MNNLLKSLLLVALAISFTQCEKDDDATGSETPNGSHEVLVNGVKLNVNETDMYLEDGESTLTYATYCTDGSTYVSFDIEPPSLEEIEGTYEPKIGIDPYDLVYSSIKYSVMVGDARQVYESKLSSEVTVGDLGDNKYKFELDLRFKIDENTTDTISGYYYTAILK